MAARSSLHGRRMETADIAPFKNRGLRARLGFAAAGIGVVARREKSFRTQLRLALAAGAAAAWLRPPLVWIALLIVCAMVVLALEAVNGALEYLIDHVHPGRAEEIGRAKDAAAGAVLIASLGAAAVGGLMLLAVLQTQ
jgi:undecaprenol kinase